METGKATIKQYPPVSFEDATRMSGAAYSRYGKAKRDQFELQKLIDNATGKDLEDLQIHMDVMTERCDGLEKEWLNAYELACDIRQTEDRHLLNGAIAVMNAQKTGILIDIAAIVVIAIIVGVAAVVYFNR